MTKTANRIILAGLGTLAIAASYWVATGTQSVLFVLASVLLVMLGLWLGAEDAEQNA